jgi:hypothetical protein
MSIATQVPAGVGNLGLPEILKPGQGILSQINGDRKILLDRSFTRMLCKGCRPLSLGEDKHLKQWILQLTGGRYVPDAANILRFCRPDLF